MMVLVACWINSTKYRKERKMKPIIGTFKLGKKSYSYKEDISSGSGLLLFISGVVALVLVAACYEVFLHATPQKAAVVSHMMLPATGNAKGDVRKVLTMKRHFVWTGEQWVMVTQN